MAHISSPTPDMASIARFASEIQFSITGIHTVTLRLPTDIFKREETRRFYVTFPATEGDPNKAKKTGLVPIDRQSLRWKDTLTGFTLHPSSQLILQVFEDHQLRSPKSLATFVLSYDSLLSSQNTFVLQNTDPKSSSIKMTISFSVLRVAESGPVVIQIPAENPLDRITPDGDEPGKTVSTDPILQPMLQAQHVPIPTTTTETSIPSSSASIKKADISRLVHNTVNDLGKIKPPQGATVGAIDVVSSIGTALEVTDTAVKSVEAFLEKCKIVADRIEFVVGAVDKIAEIHPYASAVWGVISFIPKTISQQITLDKAMLDFLDEIIQALHLAPDTETLDAAKLRSQCEQSGNRRQTVQRLLHLITDCVHFIQSYTKDINFWKRVVKNFASNKMGDITGFRKELKKLHDAFIDETIVNIDINVIRIVGQVESISEHLEDHDLDTKFPFVPGTRFKPEKGCLEGTRIHFLNAITDWVNDLDPSSPKVLTLFGQAGTGKSSIAHEIAKRFDATRRLATSYCFVRGVTSRDPHKFFYTLARNLCAICPAFKAAVVTAIRTQPDLLAADDYPTLFESLIVGPLEGLQFVGPVLIIIDALDESEDVNSNALYTFLGERVTQLPPNFRLLVTSRPEQDIMEAFPNSPLVRRVFMDDPQLAEAVDNDIYIYLQTKLRGAGIDDHILRQLAQKSERTFQWAFVACNYIAKPPGGLSRQICIKRVLYPTGGKESLNPLDAIYTTVLERFNMDDSYICNNFRSVMGQVLGVFEPLPIAALNMIRQYGAEVDVDSATDVTEIIGDMKSLLSNVASDSDGPVSPLHTSFRDFLTNPDRSGKFCINLDTAHDQLASATIHTMKAILHFNICKLDTSYCFNSEVPDLRERITEHIPSALSYSCRFWARHLRNASESDAELFRNLQAFMEEKLLFWLEVLSLMDEVPLASTALLLLRVWLGQRIHKDDGITKLDALVKDAATFVRYFGCPIAQSAPHIYISALPFSPSSSVVAKLYLPRFPRTLGLERGRMSQWPALEMAFSVPFYSNSSRLRSVICVAWSSDNERIAAAASHPAEMFIWNALKGKIVSGPFGIDNENISSIAFSPDGLYLASGSFEGRIRIWDAMTGKEVGSSRVLDGHIGAVSALSFSQDGKQLVSGSMDCTVRVWHTWKREMVAGPFSGHNNPVWAVSFTEDHVHIVSRSGSRAVRAWNVETGQRVMEPFESKNMNISTGIINTVCTEIDSSEFDIRYNDHFESNFTACSWIEAAEEEKVQGYSADYWMRASALSLDGKFIATCSATQISIWHASGELAGKLAAGPFSNDRVTCIAFSADGQHIVSGSYAGTVRIWSVETVNPVEKISAQQSHPSSVAFTDAEQIVLGQSGGKIQVLDALTGQVVMKLHESTEHKGKPVVAVSQDGDLIAWTKEKEMHVSTRTGDAVAGPLSHDDTEITAVSFSPTLSDIAALGTASGTVYLWNARTGCIIAGPKKICHEKVTFLALSCSCGDNASIWAHVAASSGSEVFIWDTLTGDVSGPFSNHGAKVGALVASTDGKYMTSAAQDYSLCVWDPVDRKLTKGPARWREDKIGCMAVALTQNGQRVAFSEYSTIILVFEVLYTTSGEMVFEGPLSLAGYPGWTRHMAFSRNEHLLATASEGRVIKIWDIKFASEHDEVLTDDKLEGIDWEETCQIGDDGWLKYGGDSPSHLVWIPPFHQRALHQPRNVCVIGWECLETRLDLKGFAHGDNWIECFEGCD